MATTAQTILKTTGECCVEMKFISHPPILLPFPFLPILPVLSFPLLPSSPLPFPSPYLHNPLPCPSLILPTFPSPSLSFLHLTSIPFSSLCFLPLLFPFLPLSFLLSPPLSFPLLLLTSLPSPSLSCTSPDLRPLPLSFPSFILPPFPFPSLPFPSHPSLPFLPLTSIIALDSLYWGWNV